ncbi:MAG: hypothetical protein WD030_04395, partial [Pirellulales bacterium]
MFFEIGVPLPAGSTEALSPKKTQIDKLLEFAPNYEIKVPEHSEHHPDRKPIMDQSNQELQATIMERFAKVARTPNQETKFPV